MDFIWILFAYFCGLAVKVTGLPPLIGFLFAGFFLHFLGIEPTESLDTLANLGITLMLFTIGLKINVRDLLRTEVWLGTATATSIWLILFIGLAFFLSAISVPYFSDISLTTAALLGFAFSFSSTVCIVKVLEQNGELKTRHGQLALGILVMQDIAAVLFLVIATGKTPSLWAFALIFLLFSKPIFSALLNKAGHGEMLPLTGFFFALGGYELFSLVGIKGDLGALIFGILLSQHSKANELTKSLLSFKDLFLIGFFLSIGFTALPTLSMIATAFILSLSILVKFLLFFFIFASLKLRSRSSYLSALILSNFSEFGLIIVSLCVEEQWLDQQWLVIIALAVAMSFIITGSLYPFAHRIYSKHKHFFSRFQTHRALAPDKIQLAKQADILVIGLGRVGKGAYLALHNMNNYNTVGLDSDRARIAKLKESDMTVVCGDGEDADFWQMFDHQHIKLVLLALPAIEDIKNINYQLREAGYSGAIAAIARYEDDRSALLESGIDKVFNFYKEAGVGFAEDSLAMIENVK